MTLIPLLYLAMIALVAAIVALTLWARVRRHLKVLVLILTAVWVVVAYVAYIDLLSRPKPVELEFLRASTPEAEVFAGRVVEGEAIYVWLGFPDVIEPRAYRLPFDRQIAEELRKALREGERTGSGVRMRLPFEPSLDDGEPRFYAPPQPRTPLKPVPEGSSPLKFNRPGVDA